MELVMTTGLCGPKTSLIRGDTHEPDDDFEAVRLVRAGFAKPKNKTEFDKAAKAFDAAEAKKQAEAEKAEAAKAKASQAKKPAAGDAEAESTESESADRA